MIVGFVSAPLFGFLFSTQMLIWVAVGGRGTIIGPMIGAIGLSFVTSELSASYPTEWALFLGLLFVGGRRVRPGRRRPAARARLGRRLLRRRRAPRLSRRLVATAPPRAPDARPRGEPICVVSEVEFAYGALEVLRGVDFEIRAGELLCIVGPNGAGKSTLLNVLTDGKLPSKGSMSYFVHHGEVRAQREADPRDRPRGRGPQVPDPAPVRQPHGRRDDPARLSARAGCRRSGGGRREIRWAARCSTSSTPRGSTVGRTRPRPRSPTASSRGSSSRRRLGAP